MSKEPRFHRLELDDELVAALRRFNPWWEGIPRPGLRAALRRFNPWRKGVPHVPQPGLPPHPRHMVAAIHRKFGQKLAPVVVVRGPRQVGKSTAQLQVVHDLLERGVDPRRLFRIQCDDPPVKNAPWQMTIMRCIDWFEEEILGKHLNQAAHDGEEAFVLLDEVQVLRDWDAQLKSLVDSTSVRVLVTGSSALRIERGRDSLAGRITTLEVGGLSLTEIARFHDFDLDEPFFMNGLAQLGDVDFWRRLREHGERHRTARDEAFRLFSERGGYPVMHQEGVDWAELADQLLETVIQRMLRHDLHLDDASPLDAPVLEEIFRLACRYTGQAPSAALLAREASRSLGTEILPLSALDYLDFLADTLLVRLVPSLEMRLKRVDRRDKICLADLTLRASWLQEVVPLDPQELAGASHLAPVAGRLAESVVGTTLATISGLDLAHRPGRGASSELDFVLTLGLKRIPVEVKYQRRIDLRRDVQGLCDFLDQDVNHAPFGLLITQTDVPEPDDPRIVALPLATLMLLR